MPCTQALPYMHFTNTRERCLILQKNKTSQYKYLLLPVVVPTPHQPNNDSGRQAGGVHLPHKLPQIPRQQWLLLLRSSSRLYCRHVMALTPRLLDKHSRSISNKPSTIYAYNESVVAHFTGPRVIMQFKIFNCLHWPAVV